MKKKKGEGEKAPSRPKTPTEGEKKEAQGRHHQKAPAEPSEGSEPGFKFFQPQVGLFQGKARWGDPGVVFRRGEAITKPGGGPGVFQAQGRPLEQREAPAPSEEKPAVAGYPEEAFGEIDDQAEKEKEIKVPHRISRHVGFRSPLLTNAGRI